MFFSIIVPVYNRPDEIDELLESISVMDFTLPYEVIIIEDGSTITCEHVIKKFNTRVNISYYFKLNSGPGDSRNFGMQKAKGDYFLIFDSDCIIPKHYLNAVQEELNLNFAECFGGPDAALASFSDVQKAINFTMTAFLTTGGIRGGSEKISKFQPRSFNMGISKVAFEASKGFGNIHPGEDPDLSIRLWNLGFETRLFPDAFVYHKRRIDWYKFYQQVNKFGKARPILNSWYPEYNKFTFFFPTLFLMAFAIALLLILWNFYFPILVFAVYFKTLFLQSSWKNKNLKIGLLSVFASCIQFYGYGLGFLNSFVNIVILSKNPEQVFPELFFKK